LAPDFGEALGIGEFGQPSAALGLAAGNQVVQLASFDLGDVFVIGHAAIDDHGAAFGQTDARFERIECRRQRGAVLGVAGKDLMGRSRVEVKTQRDGDTTYALCRSAERSDKDRAIRAKHEGRLLADLDKLGRRVAAGQLKRSEKIAEAIGRLKERYPRVARYYELAVDPDTAQFSATLKEEERADAARLDGCYLIKTDRSDLSAVDFWQIYALLTRAEDAFRDVKTPLAERPIYHQNEHRVESHLCVLAFHLLVAIEKTLLDRGLHTSWASLRATLKTHQVCTIVLPTKGGQTLRIRKASTPEKELA
jgi:hypothetical protein